MLPHAGNGTANPQDSPNAAFNLILFVVRAWAASLEVFLHRDIGTRYLNFQAAAVLLLIPLYMCLWEGHDGRPLSWFCGIYLLMCFAHRVDGVKRLRLKQAGHSRYTGTPLIWRLLPKFSEIAIKKGIEPIFVIGIGMLLCGWNQPLGSYLVIGGVCLGLSVAADDAVSQARAMEMNDAVIEQQIVADRFREMRGEDY